MATISNTPRPAYAWSSTDNVWYPIGVGAHSHSDVPLATVTAKGDLIVGTGSAAVSNLAAGTNGYYLQADSTQATGLKWAAVSSYSAPTIGSTSIASGATVTTLNGIIKLQSTQYTQLDGNGYEMDINLLTIAGALI